MSVTSDKLRAEFGAQDAIRDAGLTTPKDIKRYDDIAYGPHSQQKLDVYRPRDAQSKLPVIVSVHGGGWVYGDKELYQYYTMDLARRGFAVVNFSYRLAPETKFPAQMEDVKSVFAWTEAHAEVYGFDMDNLFAIGDSAGAHMLGMYCNACTNPEYAKRYPFDTPFGPVPKAVSFACGAYTIGGDVQTDWNQDLALMEDLLPEGATEDNLATVDVRRWITQAFPETFFFTCTGDFLQEQAEALQTTLRKQSVPHIMRFYGDAEHTLGHVFQCNIRSDFAKRCNDEQCTFFKNKMKNA